MKKYLDIKGLKYFYEKIINNAASIEDVESVVFNKGTIENETKVINIKTLKFYHDKIESDYKKYVDDKLKWGDALPQ